MSALTPESDRIADAVLCRFRANKRLMHRNKNQAGPLPRSVSCTCVSSALFTNSTKSIAAPSWVRNGSIASLSVAASLPASQLPDSSLLRPFPAFPLLQFHGRFPPAQSSFLPPISYSKTAALLDRSGSRRAVPVSDTVQSNAGRARWRRTWRLNHAGLHNTLLRHVTERILCRPPSGCQWRRERERRPFDQ
jgi:hypothetical protein